MVMPWGWALQAYPKVEHSSARLGHCREPPEHVGLGTAGILGVALHEYCAVGCFRRGVIGVGRGREVLGFSSCESYSGAGQ